MSSVEFSGNRWRWGVACRRFIGESSWETHLGGRKEDLKWQRENLILSVVSANPTEAWSWNGPSELSQMKAMGLDLPYNRELSAMISPGKRPWFWWKQFLAVACNSTKDVTGSWKRHATKGSLNVVWSWKYWASSKPASWWGKVGCGMEKEVKLVWSFLFGTQQIQTPQGKWEPRGVNSWQFVFI